MEYLLMTQIGFNDTGIGLNLVHTAFHQYLALV
jgi:hypothetical protein